MKQHYKTLGLQEGASQEEIQVAYERLSKELDPANNDNQEFFKEEYKKLQQAYKALSASSILATEGGAKNVYSKPKEEKSQKDEPANTKPPKSHTNKTKVIVGIVIGTFSSIFVASSVALLLNDKMASKRSDKYKKEVDSISVVK